MADTDAPSRARIIWSTAMSMDGRIAGADDDMSFLKAIGEDTPGVEDEWTWSTFVGSLDAVIIGGSTLRWLLDGGHGWPHGDLPTWLVSRDPDLLARVGDTEAPLLQRAGDLRDIVAEVDAAGHARVWLCGGGNVAGQLLALDRIDQVVVTIGPTVLGAGPSLFDAPNLQRRAFTLSELRRYGTDSARLVWNRST